MNDRPIKEDNNPSDAATKMGSTRKRFEIFDALFLSSVYFTEQKICQAKTRSSRDLNEIKMKVSRTQSRSACFGQQDCSFSRLSHCTTNKLKSSIFGTCNQLTLNHSPLLEQSLSYSWGACRWVFCWSYHSSLGFPTVSSLGDENSHYKSRNEWLIGDVAF